MRKKSIAIVQSNYIPWKGYFDMINSVDEFILFDDAQYTKNDWRNRNLIKTRNGPLWLTVPVLASGRFRQRVRDAVIAGRGWHEKHWKSISQSYSHAAHFAEYRERFEELYAGASDRHLSMVNRHFIIGICRILGIATKISWSWDYELRGGKIERLLSLCAQAGASEYLTGPAARSYLDEAPFAERGIKVRWMDYSGYPEYEQPFPPFEHKLSVIDVIFNTGPRAREYMKSFK